jgi:arylsulfatase A-like enzyme
MSAVPAFLEASGDTVLLQTQKWLLGVRHEGWKYIYRPQMDGQEELYDLTAAPTEKHNIANQNPAKASQLRQLIETNYIKRGLDDETAELDLTATEERLRDLGYF